MYAYVSLHHADARGGSQGSCYRRKYRDGEVDDFFLNLWIQPGIPRQREGAG